MHMLDLGKLNAKNCEMDNDADPPQQKSFAMFKWMGEHVGSR
jgi:hypothetical protein